ncbi:MAG: lamin tail domain-containing protein [Kiritimatiellae bacterium]|nr:lamin tail domain-containing protein [Kiritimatiellia bacterium]
MDFDDSTWGWGAGPFGYGLGGLGTTLTDMQGSYSTFFIRRSFTISGMTPETRLKLAVDFNDGFVVWINGECVQACNEPDGPPSFDSLAAEARDAGVLEEFRLPEPSGYLTEGENVIAVQVFNFATDSADCGIDLELSDYRRVADTTFSHDRGFYDAPFTCTISTETDGATIRYTLDGSDPKSAVSNVIAGVSPLAVLIDPDSTANRLMNGETPPCVTLRAYAAKEGHESTGVDTHTYIFVDKVVNQKDCMVGEDWMPPIDLYNEEPTPSVAARQATDMDPTVVADPAYSNLVDDALLAVPSMSIVMPYDEMWGTNGIYANPHRVGDDDWTRIASVELIDPSGTNGFQVDCGISIAGRAGRNTANPKHSFNLSFKSQYGASKLKYELFPGCSVDSFDAIRLRAGSNDKFVSNCGSNSVAGRVQYSRDSWARQTQRDMGWVAPYDTWVHLYINGVYWGLYNPCEKPNDSYMASHFGGEKEDYDVISNTQWPFIDPPNPEPGRGVDIYPNIVDGTVDAFAAMTNITDLANPANYALRREYLDVVQFTDYVLLQIYGQNWDWAQPTDVTNWRFANLRAGRKTRNRGLHDVPYQFFVWDYELALHVGNADYSWMAQEIDMIANPDYRMLFADRIYRHLIRPGGALTVSAVSNRYAAISGQIELPIVCESARWGDAGQEPPQTRDGQWAPERARLFREYFSVRTAKVVDDFRNGGLYPSIEPPDFSREGGAIDNGFKLTMQSAEGYTIYYTTDGTDPRLPGGGVAETAELYAQPVKLDMTTHVKARLYKSAETWSAVHEATFNYTAHYSKIRITEIMYDPLGGSDFEFVEIKNTSSSAVRGLSLVSFEGDQYTFDAGTVLEAGAFILLVRNLQAFTNRYPDVAESVAFIAEFRGKLDNDGESITLTDSDGVPIVSVKYDDKNSWDEKAGGSGFSLVPVDPTGDYSDDDASSYLNWRASRLIGGSPGYDDPAPYRIVISEALTHTDFPDTDAIELHNKGADPIDVGGWYLSDSDADYRKFQIPAGTVLEAGGYVVFNEFDFNSDPTNPACFALSSHGDEIYLSNWDDQGRLQYLDQVRFDGAWRGHAFARHTKSDGGDDFVTQSATNTLGAANAYPRVGPIVINELMYNPVDGLYEFVELYNAGTNLVKLYDPNYPANCWMLTGVGDYAFPSGASLAPGEYALAIPTDAATFRQAYPGVPAGMQLFGPYDGALGNGGDTIKLWQPDTPDEAGIPWILVDKVCYADTAPWPESADGGGPSIQRVAADLYGNDPANWIASPAGGGTPGLENALPPAAPAALTAADTSVSRIDLAWEDRSSDEDGFIIERRTETGTWTNLVTLGAGTEAYADCGLPPSVTFYYRVQAYNANGGSDYSAAQSAATLPIYVQFVTAQSSGAEDVSPACVVITLSAAALEPAGVDYRVAGGTAANGADYSLADGTLTFAPGETSRSVSIVVLNDEAVESNESIVLALANPALVTLGARATHTYVIFDDDSVAGSSTPIVTIAKGAAWRYRPGTAPAAAQDSPVWRTRLFDDSAWNTGSAPFGYGDAGTGSFGTTLDMQNDHTSVFLRKTFTVPNAARIARVDVWAQYDDGFALWVNGREVARVNVDGTSGSPLAYDDVAASDLEPDQEWSVSLAGGSMCDLLNGTNVVAVQLLNATAASEDLLFDFELSLYESLAVDDGDNDGMPNGWESVWFGGYDEIDGGDTEDFDGDGIPNLEEYVAGTCPDDESDWLAVDIEGCNGTIIVSFDGREAAGSDYLGMSRHYVLEQQADGGDGYNWQVVPGFEDVIGTGGTISHTNGIHSGGMMYRVRTWLENN